MPFTYSISNGLFFGLGSFVVLYIVSGELFYKIGWMKKSNDEKFGNDISENIEERMDSNDNNNNNIDIDNDMEHTGSVVMSPMSADSLVVSVQSYENLIENYARDYRNNNKNNNNNDESKESKQIFNQNRSRIDLNNTKDASLP